MADQNPSSNVDWSEFQPVETKWSDFEPANTETPEGGPYLGRKVNFETDVPADYGRPVESQALPLKETGKQLWEGINTPFTKMANTSAYEVEEKLRPSTLPVFGIPVPIPSEEQLGKLGPLGKIAIGTRKAEADLTDSLLTPLGVMTLGIGSLPKLAQRVIAGLFAADMASHVPGQIGQTIDAIKSGDAENITRSGLGTVGGVLMAGVAAKSAAMGHPLTPAEQAKIQSDRDAFWTDVNQNKIDLSVKGPDVVSEAAGQIYEPPVLPKPAVPGGRLRGQLRPQNRLRSQPPTQGESSAIPEIQQQSGDQSQLQGVPPRQDIQPNQPEVRPPEGDQTNGGGGAVQPAEVQPEPNAVVGPVKSGFSPPLPPQSFETLQALLDYRQKYKDAEIQFYKSLGMTDSEAKKFFRAGDSRSQLDVSNIEAKLTPENQARLEAFSTGEGKEMYQWDRMFNPENLNGVIDRQDLASSLVGAIGKGEMNQGLDDKFIYSSVALRQLLENGGTWSDIARALDRFTTQNSGSQGDKVEYFKSLGAKIRQFAKLQGLEPAQGDLVDHLQGGETPEQIASTTPQPDWKVVVQGDQGEVPGYVQIVDPRQTEQSQSPTIESLKAAGHEAPDFTQLPQGNYTWEQAVNKLAEKPPVEAAKPEVVAPAVEQVPQFQDWRIQGNMIRHSGVGRKLNPEQAASVIETLKKFNVGGRFDAARGAVMINSGLMSDVGRAWDAAGSYAKRVSKSAQANEVVRQRTQQVQAQRETELSQSPAVAWIDETFGVDAMNPFNKLELAKFLEGKTPKFGGMSNNKWAPGMSKLKATSLGDVKQAYEQSKSTQPPVAPVAEVKPFPAELAKRLISLPYEQQSGAFGPSNVELRRDILEFVTGKRPPISKSGAMATGQAMAKFFGIDPNMAGTLRDDAVIAKLNEAAGVKPVQENVPPTPATVPPVKSVAEPVVAVPPVESAKTLKAGNVDTTANVAVAEDQKPVGAGGFSTKAAREQKKFLLDAVDQAIAEAPDASPTVPADADMASVNSLADFDKGDTKETFEAKRAEQLPPLFEKYDVPTIQPAREAHKSLDADVPLGNDKGERAINLSIDSRYQLLVRAIAAERFRQLPKVTIEVPGDGTFDIINTKDALKDAKERFQKFPTSAPKPKQPGFARENATPAVPLGKPDVASAVKALAAIVSDDRTRPVIHNIWSDGKVSVATDGRRLAIVKVGIGKGDNRNVFSADGKPVKLPKDSVDFPNWKQVVPKESLHEVKNLDTERMFNLLTQAIQTTTDRSNSVMLYRNKDGTLGFKSGDPDLGSYETNVQEDAQAILSINPVFLTDAMNVARRMGDKTISLHYTDELSPVEVKSKNTHQVIMPMRMSSLGTPERQGAVAEPAAVTERLAVGPEQIRALIAESGLPARTVQIVNAMLEQPVMRDLDWSGLELALKDRIEGGLAGSRIGHYLEMAADATPETFAHEVFHILYDMLPQDARAQIDGLRTEALNKMFPQGAPEELKAGTMTSDEFLQSRLDPEVYHLINPSEFMAWFGSSKFSSDVFEGRNRGAIASLVQKVRQWVTGLVDALKRAVGANQSMERVTRELLAGVYRNSPETGKLFEEREASLGKAMENLEVKEAEEPGSGIENVRMEQGAQVVAQHEKVTTAIDQLRSLANQQLPRTATSEQRMQRDTARRVLGNPWVRSQFAQPVAQMERAAFELGRTAETYQTMKADPSVTPAMKSAMAGKAAFDLDGFYKAKAAFDVRYQTKVDELQTELNEVMEMRSDASVNKLVHTALLDDFTEMGREMVKQAGQTGQAKGLRQMLGQAEAVKNVLNFVADNFNWDDVGPDWKPTRENVVELISDLALAKTGNPTMEQAVGASRDVIEGVADFMSKNERLRQTMMEGGKLLKDKAATGVFDKLKAQLAKAIEEKKFDKAFNILVKGVGDTEAQRGESAAAARLLARKQGVVLSKLEALRQSKELMDTVEGSKEFRALATEVYGDIGARDVIRGLAKGENGYLLEPVFKGQQPTMLSLDSSKIASDENLKKLQAYREDATTYLSDPEAEGYNPTKAAALKEWLNQSDWWMDPALNPKAGRLLPSVWAELPIKLLSVPAINGLPPNVMLRQGAGLAAEHAIRTLNAWSTAKEVGMATYSKWEPQLNRALKQAIDGHQMSPEQWKELIFNPLAASHQYFGNVRKLGVGSKIGNGYTVTAQDMAFFNTVKSFEGEMIRRLTGTAKENFEVLKNNPAGILYNENGQLRIRLPFETGPNTVSRKFGEARRWAQEWSTLDTPTKAKFLNQHLDRVLFGYLNDVGQASFGHRYAYPDEFRAVLEQARDGNPVGSLEDLSQRVADLWNERLDVEPITAGEVQAAIVRDIGTVFDRIRRYDQEGMASSKTKINAYGGENSFNTERGGQIMPGNWYDYGSVTTMEHLAYMHTAMLKFAIEHQTAVEAADEATKRVVKRFAEQKLAEPGRKVSAESRKQAKAGTDFYSWGQAKDYSRQLTRYLNALKSALEYENRVKETGSDLKPGWTLWNFMTGSVLSTPSPNIMNSFGGLMNVVLAERTLRNLNMPTALVKNLALAGKRVVDDTLMVMASDKTPAGRLVYNALQATKSLPIVGKLPEILANNIDRTRQLYQDNRRDGLVLNQQLGNQLKSMWELRDMGGIVGPRVSEMRAIRLFRNMETLIRGTSKTLGQATVGYVDSRINVTAQRISEELQQDLESRARDYGELRAGRGQYSAKELRAPRVAAMTVSVPDMEAQATRLRNFLRQEADVNLDAQMHDFWARYKAATDQEQAQGLKPGDLTKDVHLFTDSQLRQIKLAVAADTNLATFANRPIGSKTGALGKSLSLFLGYPSFELFKLTSLLDTMSNQGKVRRRISNLPLALGAIAATTIIASLGQKVSNEAMRLIMNRYRNTGTIFEARNGQQAVQAAMNAFASMVPFYGSAINTAMGTAFKSGYDINSQFVALNLATDAMKSLKYAYQTGEIGYPMLRFLQRWSFPANYLAQLDPTVQGLQEVSNAKNLMLKGARGSDMESLIKKGSDTDFQYTPVTPLLNQAMAAIGRGDINGFNQAYQQIVAFKQAEGSANPEQAALASLSGPNPMMGTFGRKLTEDELAKVLANLPQDDSAKVRGFLAQYDQALNSVGGSPSARVAQFGAPQARTARFAGRGGLRRGMSRTGRVRGLRAPRLRASRSRFRPYRNRLRAGR